MRSTYSQCRGQRYGRFGGCRSGTAFCIPDDGVRVDLYRAPSVTNAHPALCEKGMRQACSGGAAMDRQRLDGRISRAPGHQYLPRPQSPIDSAVAGAAAPPVETRGGPSCESRPFCANRPSVSGDGEHTPRRGGRPAPYPPMLRVRCGGDPRRHRPPHRDPRAAPTPRVCGPHPTAAAGRRARRAGQP